MVGASLYFFYHVGLLLLHPYIFRDSSHHVYVEIERHACYARLRGYNGGPSAQRMSKEKRSLGGEIWWCQTMKMAGDICLVLRLFHIFVARMD